MNRDYEVYGTKKEAWQAGYHKALRDMSMLKLVILNNNAQKIEDFIRKLIDQVGEETDVSIR